MSTSPCNWSVVPYVAVGSREGESENSDRASMESKLKRIQDLALMEKKVSE
jgi:hypothetical protein